MEFSHFKIAAIKFQDRFSLRFFVFLLVYVFCLQASKGQTVKANAGFLLKAQIILGNQKQSFKLGAYGIGAVHYGDIALESGISLYSGYLFKKHKIKISGFNYGYDAFVLGGIGKNNNLLASSFFEDAPLLTSLQKKQKFYGLGFGVEKEFLPGKLSFFNQRLGKLLVRLSNANQSINVQFKNDVRLGNVFYGEGTDYGATGKLEISYSNIINSTEVYHVGAGISLFTPSPDYSRTPNNPQNSDDRSKNVWHTKPTFNQLFYANLYVLGSYQKDFFSMALKSGVNSQKLGAYIQNTLHDSFGLNPRFPWDVSAKDLLYFEVNANVFNTTIIDD